MDEDFRDEINFVGIRAGLVAMGLAGWYVFDMGWVWIPMFGLIGFGLFSLAMYLSMNYKKMQEMEPNYQVDEEESVRAPIIFNARGNSNVLAEEV